jgi:site-specific recombinase XerD
MKQESYDAGNFPQLKEAFERRLVTLRYSKVTIQKYMRTFGWVQEFVENYGELKYTQEAGALFITEYLLQSQHNPVYFQEAKVTIHRLNEILEGKSFAPRFCEPKPDCPERFRVHRDVYFAYLKKCGMSASTLRNHARHVNRLLGRLPESLQELSELTAAVLYEVLTRYEPRTGGMSVARRFFRFLFDEGVTANDFSVCVPKVRAPRPMPSVYTRDEVSRLLASVDRTTGSGKRDYAILMLAAKLGLRSSDIVNLALNDIDRKDKTIEIVQVKTGRPLTLVLNQDVEDAINDYLLARPESESDKVFLGSRAPYAPLTPASGHAIAHRHFKLADIVVAGRQQGTHALRMSYATALVTKGVPYAIIKEALGHDDPEASKYYVRVDVRRLRTCAIGVPVPTGAFAMNLNDLEGGI